MLQRLQNYTAGNPLNGWLLTVGVMLVFNALFLWALPDARKPGLVGLMLCYALGPPSMNLLRRFSKQQRAEKPIAAHQENAVGLIALFAACGSVVALGVAVFGKRIGLALPDNTQISLLFGYGLLLLQALIFGAAAEHTKTGLWAFRIAAVWFGLLVATALWIVAGILL